MLGSWWCGAIVLVCARCLASYLCWCDTFFPLCPYVAHTPPALWCPRLHLPLAVLVKQPYCAASEKPWKPRLKKLWINTLSFFFLFFPNCATFSEANGGGVCQINVKADGWLSLVIEQQAETRAAVLVSRKNQCFEVLNCRPDAVAVQTEHNLFSSVTNDDTVPPCKDLL